MQRSLRDGSGRLAAGHQKLRKPVITSGNLSVVQFTLCGLLPDNAAAASDADVTELPEITGDVVQGRDRAGIALKRAA